MMFESAVSSSEDRSCLVNMEEGGAELAEAVRLDGALKGLEWSSRAEQLILQ